MKKVLTKTPAVDMSECGKEKRSFCSRTPAMIAKPDRRLTLEECADKLRSELDSAGELLSNAKAAARALACVAPTERLAAYKLAAKHFGATLDPFHLEIKKMVLTAADLPTSKKEPFFHVLPDCVAFADPALAIVTEIPPKFHALWTPMTDLLEFARNTESPAHSDHFSRVCSGLELAKYRHAALAAAVAVGRHAIVTELGGATAADVIWHDMVLFQIIGALHDKVRFAECIRLVPVEGRDLAVARLFAGALARGPGYKSFLEQALCLTPINLARATNLAAPFDSTDAVLRIAAHARGRCLVFDQASAALFSNISANSLYVLVNTGLVCDTYVEFLMTKVPEQQRASAALKVLPCLSRFETIEHIWNGYLSPTIGVLGHDTDSIMFSQRTRGVFVLLAAGKISSAEELDASMRHVCCALFALLRDRNVIEHLDKILELLARCISRLETNEQLALALWSRFQHGTAQANLYHTTDVTSCKDKILVEIFATAATLAMKSAENSCAPFALLFDAAVSHEHHDNLAEMQKFFCTRALKRGLWNVFELLRKLSLSPPAFTASNLIDIFKQAYYYRYSMAWPKLLQRSIAGLLGPHGAWAAETNTIKEAVAASGDLRRYVVTQCSAVSFCVEFADLFADTIMPAQAKDLFWNVLQKGAGKAAEYFWRRYNAAAVEAIAAYVGNLCWTPTLLRFCERHAGHAVIAELLKRAHCLLVDPDCPKSFRVLTFIREPDPRTGRWGLPKGEVEILMREAISGRKWAFAQRIADSGFLTQLDIEKACESACDMLPRDLLPRDL